MGTPNFAVPSLKLLAANNNILAVFSQPARPNGRGMKTIDSPIENVAKKLNLRTITPYNLKDDKIFLEYKKLNPDIVIVVAYGLILPERFLKIPKFGCINVHPSLLPEFAGGMDLNVHEEVIKSGKKVTGCTVHLVTEEVDSGPIIIQKSCTVDENETVDTLKSKVQYLEGEALIESVRCFMDGFFPKTASTSTITYADSGVNIAEGNALSFPSFTFRIPKIPFFK